MHAGDQSCKTKTQAALATRSVIVGRGQARTTDTQHHPKVWHGCRSTIPSRYTCSAAL